jgi:phage anti-repressor protein
MNLIKNNNDFFVSGMELHKKLGMKRAYSKWIKESIERAYLEPVKDFLSFMSESNGGRPSEEFLLKKEAAIQIIIMSGGQFAKDLRKKVIELYKQHETGLAFTADQITTLIDLSKVMCLISIQEKVESKHFKLYNQPQNWWDYRAALLGYSKDSLIEAMRAVNKKYISMRASLLKLDANELIRTGVIDFMLAIGKTEEYAKNVGALCYDMANKMELGKFIWDDTKPDQLGINKQFVVKTQKLKESMNLKQLE